MMPRDREMDLLWISLAILFSVLAVFHAYLAITSNLQVKVSDSNVFPDGDSSSLNEGSLGLIHRLNQEMTSAINSFVSSYNKSSRLANIFGACGYAVAGITCLFCLAVKRKGS